MIEPVRTAVLLAAGTGSRLQPLTNSAPKCLTEVSGIPILQRLTVTLSRHGFTKLVVIIGHLGGHIRRFLAENPNGLSLQFIENPVYATTNNLYSLWLARLEVREPFLLVEADLVFDDDLLGKLLIPERAAIAAYDPAYMSGTTVLLDSNEMITQMDVGRSRKPEGRLYKTVNIYSLSLPSWDEMIVRMGQKVKAGSVNDYYEVVLADMIKAKQLSLQAVDFNAGRWFEIDTLDDLRKAEQIFVDKSGDRMCV